MLTVSPPDGRIHIRIPPAISLEMEDNPDWWRQGRAYRICEEIRRVLANTRWTSYRVLFDCTFEQGYLVPRLHNDRVNGGLFLSIRSRHVLSVG